MEKCKKCKHNYKPSSCEPKCNRMCENYSDFESITNADKIRSMTDEELADWINGMDHYWDDGQFIVRIGNAHLNDSKEDIFDWLKEKAEE